MLLKSKLSEYYAALVIFLCSIFAFYKYVLQVSPSIMTDALMRAFHVSGMGLGTLAATYFYSYIIFQVAAGFLLDRYNPRYIMTVAIMLCGLGALGFGRSHSIVMASLSRACIGAGTAFVTIGYLKLSVLLFKSSKVAFVDGFYGTACMLGAMFGQMPLSYLVEKVGWRESIMYCGFFGMGLSILFFLVTKAKIPFVKLTVDSYFKNIAIILKNRKNWLLMIYSGLSFTPVAVFGGLWGNPFLEETYHISTQEAAFLVSFLFLGFSIGAPFLGYVAERIGKRLKTIIFSNALGFFLLVILIYIQHLPILLVGSLIFLFGLCMGSYMSCFAVGKSINHIQFSATVVALINTGDAILGSVTEPLIGKMLDHMWSGQMKNGVHHFSVYGFHYALSLLPLYLAGGLICLLYLQHMLTPCREDCPNRR